jgi:mRNA interferase MazF
MIQRGAVYSVEFEPVLGSEANKARPAVVVSNDSANAAAQVLGRGVVTVVPTTSNIRKVRPFQVLLRARDTGLPVDSKAQAEQVRAVDVTRIGEQLGALQPDKLRQLEDALRLHLDL